MKRLVAATLLALVPAAPASAGLVTTYSMTDDVWGVPIGTGRILLDARARFYNRTPSVLELPVVSLVFGVTPWLELGANGIYSFTGLLNNGSTSTTGPVSGYAKFMLPWHPMGSSTGVLLGGSMPTAVGQTGTQVAGEGAFSMPLTEALTLDLNAGLGRNMDANKWLAHGGASLYYTLPSYQTFMLEAYGYYNTQGNGLMLGQRLGYQLPLSSANSLDFSLTVHEPSTGVELIPMVGATIMM